MSQENSCSCSGGPKLIFACSGAADVGEIADKAARQLTKEGVGKMFCLAGISAGISGIMETTRAASGILAIDGCSLACAKKTLEQASFESFRHLQLAEIGMEKFKSPVTEEKVNEVFRESKVLLGS